MATQMQLFDQFVRLNNILATGDEDEYINVINEVQILRKNTRVQVGGLKHKIEELECEKSSLLEESHCIKRKKLDLESEIGSLGTKLKHARKQIETEMQRRKKEHRMRTKLEQQVEMVREILLKDGSNSELSDEYKEKLAFLSSEYMFERNNDGNSPHRQRLSAADESVSLLSPSNFSFDKTEEDALEEMSALRSGKIYRRSIPSAPPMNEVFDLDKSKERISREHDRASMKIHRRSQSASAATVTPHRSSLYRVLSEKNAAELDCEDCITPELTTMNRAVSRKLNKPHNFISKTVIKPESCAVCRKKMKFGKVSYRCKECRVSAHPGCRENVPLPCVTVVVTPKTLQRQNAVLEDYAPSEPPYIPALIILCVNEVESRGLTDQGIYRIPGSDKEVKELKEKFLRGRKVPNLSHVGDINVICGCLKDFLRGLRESIITQKLWQAFMHAAQISDHDEALRLAYEAISQMPRTNRDTLAFIILHLQKVSQVKALKMNASNLARVFGPTLIGYSSPDAEPMQIINETQQQQAVIELLISISADYWSTFMEDVDYEGEKVFARHELNTLGTPDFGHADERKQHNISNVNYNVAGTPNSRHNDKTYSYSHYFPRFLPAPAV